VLAEQEGSRRHNERNQRRMDDVRPQLQRYEDLCAEWGLAPADVGLAWLLHQPAVTAPIVGPRTMQQFESSLGAADLTLTTEQLAALDEVFPGKKPAPMQYAW
jgi:aryl-alcohol dehydrogenase-like predicted oxidoreductase